MELNVEVRPGGAGIVEIDGDYPCSYPFTLTVDDNTYVSLEALSAPGYRFTNWSGEPIWDGESTCSENPTVVRVLHPMRIIANFVPVGREFTSMDEMLSIIIPDDTIALDGDGAPLTSVEFIIDENLSPPPEANIVGSVYSLEPEGATFEPPVTLTWSYDPDDIPPGVAEEDLAIAYHDEDIGEWVGLSSDIDAENNTITAEVARFSIFATIASSTPLPELPPPSPALVAFTTSSLHVSPSEVNTGEPVTISVLLTNSGQGEDSYPVTLTINGVIEETKEITLAGGASETVVFTTSRNEAGAYSVDVNGFPGSFTVREGTSSPASPVAQEPSSEPPAPPIAQEPSPEPPAPTPPAASGVNWVIVAPIIVAVFFAIFLPLRLRRRSGPLDW